MFILKVLLAHTPLRLVQIHGKLDLNKQLRQESTVNSWYGTESISRGQLNSNC